MRLSRFYPICCAMLLLACTLLGLNACTGPGASGAPTTPPAPPPATPAAADLAALSDEFDNAQTLANWPNHATVEGWPSQIETRDINATHPGELTLVPYTSTWFEDYRGVFLFKEGTGDFDVTTRSQATGSRLRCRNAPSRRLG